MKKIIPVILVISLMLSLCACGMKEENDVTSLTDPEEIADETVQTENEKDDGETKERTYMKSESEDASFLIEGMGTELGTAAGEIPLPSDSRSFSTSLALRAMDLCSASGKEDMALLMKNEGFEIMLQSNFDKDDSDPSHTCAYTLGKKTVEYNGEERTLFAVSVRGTNAGEWYSNFDVAPSRSNDTDFAENFLMCAEDVFCGIDGELSAAENPLILICGYSRGAACANLLGMLVNEKYGEDAVFTYTFATPATVRTEDIGTSCGNIFNIINPMDVVPRLPLYSWGFGRLGTDIMLPSDEKTVKTVEETMDDLFDLAPDIETYYKKRYSLTGPGESEDGITVYDVMLILASSFSGITDAENTDFSVQALDSISEESDLYPLVELLTGLGSDGGAGAVQILMQHLPQTYAETITSITGA